jgi:hypothetical protein
VAAICVKMRKWEEAEAARLRKATGQKRGGEVVGKRRRKDGSLPMKSSGSCAPAVEAEPGDMRARIAKEAGISQYKTQQALNVEKAAPEVLTEVAQGKKKLREAAREVKVRAGKVIAFGAARGGRRRAEPAFDMDKAVTAAMKSVDQVLDKIPDDMRGAFIDEMIGTLERLR